MICPNCYITYDDDFKFCPYCGTKKPKPKICPICHSEQKIGFNFCPKCGNALMGKKEYDEFKKQGIEELKEMFSPERRRERAEQRKKEKLNIETIPQRN